MSALKGLKFTFEELRAKLNESGLRLRVERETLPRWVTVNDYEIEDALKRSVPVRGETSELRTALEEFIEKIEGLPENTFGYSPPTPDGPGWPFRDEIAHNLREVLIASKYGEGEQ